MIDFPASPTVGQAFVDPATGLRWVWDGTKWKASGLATPPLPVPMNDNRIINGDMRIDQRGVASTGGGMSGTAIGYTCDRWQFLASLATVGGWGTGPNFTEFPNQLGFTSNLAYTLLASDYFTFMQPLEADMISDFMWGTAGAQSVTLSFRVNATIAGTYGGAVRNFAGTRSYPFTYSIPVANTWTSISITIPGDTAAGTWVLSGNAGSLQLVFAFGVGSNLTAPAGAWAGGGYLSANGCVSTVGTAGAQFFVTGVKLEIGSVATPYNRQSLAKSMADCQRYYVGNGYFNYAGFATEIAPISISQTFPTNMRAPPTIVVTPQGSLNITNPLVGPVDGTYYAVGGQSTAAGNFIYYGTFTASAEL